MGDDEKEKGRISICIKKFIQSDIHLMAELVP